MASDFEITADDAGLQKDLAALAARIDNMRPVFEVIGETLKSSVVKNFEKTKNTLDNGIRVRYRISRHFQKNKPRANSTNPVYFPCWPL
jgi:phage gpG-like protein